MKRPDVFLDRDATLSAEIGYMSDPKRLKLIPGAGRALRELSQADFKLIVVTNQSGISRKFFGLKELQEASFRLCSLFREYGVELDGIYACPHAPGFGCICRKPMPGLVIEAALEHGIDLRKSFIVGDKVTDVGLGRALRVLSVMVLTGYGKEELERIQSEANAHPKPDWVAKDILEASRWILERSGKKSS
jgi:D-glycero-D-manno-heptose 1,7-bisphosphate phosphatase